MKSQLSGRFTAGVVGCLVLLIVLPFGREARAGLIVDIQPVQICLDNGSDCSALGFDAGLLSDFWLEKAGISLNFLDSRTFNSTEFHTMDSNSQVSSFLTTLTHPDPVAPALIRDGPIHIWFSNSADFVIESNGVVGFNRSWVKSNQATPQQTLAMAIALGFNLGLTRVESDPIEQNLMAFIPAFPIDLAVKTLRPDQVDIVLSSPFLVATSDVTVPAPPPLGLLWIGLAALALLRTRAPGRGLRPGQVTAST
ncbi:MAG: hypothetical protein JJT88_00480 [Gammaproteobacteria bacterium]|nr:hypothetical protein [Gammaproteobacteria bacterium]